MRPVYIENYARLDEKVEVLDRISRQFALYDEVWLQRLVHSSPNLISTLICSKFGTLIPVVRELSVGSGRLDNLFVTAEGIFVLVEIKLWRNFESKRKIASQIRRYGSDFAKLTYETINSKIARTFKFEFYFKDPLHHIVENFTGYKIDGDVFKRRVDNFLKERKFYLVILTDEIRNELLNLMSADSSQFTVGIVEMNLYQLPGRSLIAVPKVIARPTLARDGLVEKAEDEKVRVEVLGRSGEYDKKKKSSNGAKLKLNSFYQRVEHFQEKNSLIVKQFVDSVSDLKLFLDIPDRNLIVKHKFVDGKRKSLLNFNPKWIEFWQFSTAYPDEDWERLSRAYMEKITQIIPNSYIHQNKKKNDIDVKINDQFVPIEAVGGRVADLSNIFRSALVEANRLISERSRL